MKIAIYFVIILSCVSFGCSKSNQSTFAMLDDDAVIVRVNDEELTKGDIIRFIEMERRHAAKYTGQDRLAFERRIEKDFFNFVPGFIQQRLLVQDAKKCAVLTKEQAERNCEALFDLIAKSKNVSRDELLREDSKDNNFIRDAVERRVWIDAHIASNIPPAVAVTPLMVTNYLNLIKEETLASRRTNDSIRARLDGIRADCLAGKSSFTNIAEQLSRDEWDLGEMEASQFDTTSMRDAVFALKEGMISPVLESEDDFFLLYVAKIFSAVKNEDGKTVHPERRHVYQIALEKEGYPVQLSYEQAYADLVCQLQEQALRNYVDDLKTNGVNRIEWPNGTNLFKKVSQRR